MDNISALPSSSIGRIFHLDKYGYALERVLNNQNRWHIKIVCSLFGPDTRPYVSTTYIQSHDYLKLLESTTLLNCKSKLTPSIINLYPDDNTIVCNYIGEFLQDYLLQDFENVSISARAVFEYILDINSINQGYKRFTIPSIIKSAIELSEILADDFEFLKKSRIYLPRLEELPVEFSYGYGIEDPHIWNFRVVNERDRVLAFTTDFDYFSDRVNCFWELGYFYATFRWLRRLSPQTASIAERSLISLIQQCELPSEFMFWLGALSSYCGYKESLCNLLKDGKFYELKEEYQIIKKLDEKVGFLAEKLLYKRR